MKCHSGRIDRVTCINSEIVDSLSFNNGSNKPFTGVEACTNKSLLATVTEVPNRYLVNSENSAKLNPQFVIVNGGVTVTVFFLFFFLFFL